MRLVVTRPQPQADTWVQALREQGLEAVALPLIAIGPPADAGAVHAAWQRLPHMAFVMFVSGQAVQRFFALRPDTAEWPAALHAGATGPGTAQALRAAGVAADRVVMPAARADAVDGTDTHSTWDAEALWRRIQGWPWAGRQVLVVRGEQGRDWLAAQWRAAGADVHFVEAYRRQAPQWQPAQRAAFEVACGHPADHAWLLSSSESIDHLVAMPGARERIQGATAWATHPRIAAAAQRAGFGHITLLAPELPRVAQALRAAAMADTPEDGPPGARPGMPPATPRP